MSVYDYPEYYDIATGWDISMERDFILNCFSHYCTRPVKSLLDVACGSGRLSREFSRLGMEVIGIDKSEEMVRYARQHSAETETMQFRLGDMVEFDHARCFDAVVCMLDSLAHIGTWRNVRAHLGSVRRHLAVGGVYIVDFVVAVGVKESWELERQGTRVTCEYETTPARHGRYKQKITFLVKKANGVEERIENEDDCPELLPEEFNRLAGESGLRLAASFCEHDLQKPFVIGEDRRYLGVYVAD